MLFNSVNFIVFFPIVLATLFIIPKKTRYIWLLICSYYFYMSWNYKYVILLITSTVLTYFGGIVLGHFTSSSRSRNISKKICVASCIIANLLILFVFKYFNFFFGTITLIFEKLNIGNINCRLDLLLPAGISFYTFQVIGYICDVYRGDIQPEKNFVKYALFVSFFPQLVAGPIERATNLLPQIQNIENINLWNYKRIKNGFLLMMWGFFEKVVIADRISLLVNTVYDNYQNYGMVEIIVATILFGVQIYCDFGGYTDIARGTAQIMGINLSRNFKQPYLAMDIDDFWKRWHISLTSWFTSYLYIPLGGSWIGVFRKYINILIVFLISGLWHGAQWNFVFWGLLHGIYKVIGDLKNKSKKNYNKLSLSTRIRKRITCFVLVDFAWLFFASNSFTASINIIEQSLLCFHTTKLVELGLDKMNWIILVVAIVCLFLVDLIHERGLSIIAIVEKQEFWARWMVYLLAVWVIVIFGIYGTQYDTSQFIYFQF